MNIELALDGDHDLDLPIGAVLRLKPMRDDDGQVFAYWVIDDRSGEPLDLVSAESVRRHSRIAAGGRDGAPVSAHLPEELTPAFP